MAAARTRSPKLCAGPTLSKVAGAATPYLTGIVAKGEFSVGDAGHTVLKRQLYLKAASCGIKGEFGSLGSCWQRPFTKSPGDLRIGVKLNRAFPNAPPHRA